MATVGCRRLAVVCVALLAGSVCATPAAADPVPLADSLVAIGNACRASRAALLGTGGTVSTGAERTVVSPAGFLQQRPAFNRVVVAGTGTYGMVADDGLGRLQLRRAWRYLHRPTTQWWFDAGRFWSPARGWAATFEQSRDAVVTVDETCGQSLGAAVEPVDHSGDAWQFTIPGQAGVTVVTDGQGRLAAWADTRYEYGTPAVTAPSAAVSHLAWLKAAQAAALNADLRAMTREVARQVNASVPSVAAIDAAARATNPADRVVLVRVRQLRRGVLFHARNPYTRTYHAWRVYLKRGEAVARRVAP
ncbi:MAG TPA: hypothetical protein PLT68_05195 [Actinomycetota bacterium]|nr:hypothetical protein [Actinomycetota bacterium]